LRFPGPKTQLPVGDSNSHRTLMHSGVFNMPRELRSAEAGLADECLRAEVGHADAGWKGPSMRRWG
ncbi:MAG: hypothetical protein ABSG53_30685, partial [Thermoguttaceae bacterium]